MGREETAAALLRKLTFVSWHSREPVYSLLPVMLPSSISPEDAVVTLLDHVHLACDCLCVGVYVSLRQLERHMRQRDSKRAAKAESAVA